MKHRAGLIDEEFAGQPKFILEASQIGLLMCLVVGVCGGFAVLAMIVALAYYI